MVVSDEVFLMSCLKHTHYNAPPGAKTVDYSAVAAAFGYASKKVAYNRLTKLKKDAASGNVDEAARHSDCAFILCCMQHSNGKVDGKAVAADIGYASEKVVNNRLTKLRKENPYNIPQVGSSNNSGERGIASGGAIGSGGENSLETFWEQVGAAASSGASPGERAEDGSPAANPLWRKRGRPRKDPSQPRQATAPKRTISGEDEQQQQQQFRSQQQSTAKGDHEKDKGKGRVGSKPTGSSADMTAGGGEKGRPQKRVLELEGQGPALARVAHSGEGVVEMRGNVALQTTKGAKVGNSPTKRSKIDLVDWKDT